MPVYSMKQRYPLVTYIQEESKKLQGMVHVMSTKVRF